MARRKLALATGALVLIGGAAAIAAVGVREGRFGHGERMHGMDHLAQGYGHGMGEDHRGRGMRRGDGGEHRDPDMRRGWLSRSVTAEEFDARIRERFARLDKNSDGVIDASEVETQMSEMQGHRRFGERMRERFQARFDKDRDGKITRAEVLDRVRRDFARMDLDGDGRITDADLPPPMRGRGVLKGEGFAGRGMAPMGGAMGGMGLGRLIAADANKDGVITLDEALAEAGRRFDAADRNKDGVIDQTDRDAMRKEMTDYHVKRFVHMHGGKDGRVTREQFTATAKERFAERDINNDGRIDRQDGGRGRGMGPGGMGPGGPGMMRPGQGPGPEGGPRGGPDGPGMRDRGPPR